MDIHYKWLEASPYEVEGLIGEPHQGICPDGWHIPVNEEWNEMYDAVGTTPYVIQARGQRMWPAANNVSGFSAIPVGTISNGWSYMSVVGMGVEFWSATEYSGVGNYAYLWLSNEERAMVESYVKHNGRSVRCVQDSE